MKRHIPEWRTRGMLSYLAKLGLLNQNGNSYSPTKSLKTSFHTNLIELYKNGELRLETLEDKIIESLIISLREHGFFKEAKSTKEVGLPLIFFALFKTITGLRI